MLGVLYVRLKQKQIRAVRCPKRRAGGPLWPAGGITVSEYNENNSLYENSDYPSRRQAPRHSSGGRQAPRKRRRVKKRNPVLHGLAIFFKVLGTLILIGLCTGALVACFAAVYINEVIVPQADLSMDDFPLGENSIMYYLDKETGEYKEMVTLFSSTSQIWVDYEDMPEYLKQAAVAIEDQRFWTHPGVDWKRTGKAVLAMFTGQDISGGSTITQQLIKNTTNYNETTVKRKITEIVRAFRFTQNNSKEDTLERYLNIIPLGSGCKGVGAASLEYFGKPVSQLTLAECASLIGITNNPSKYGPYSFARSKTKSTGELWDARQWNKYRQELVLQCMLEQGMISQAEHDEAVAQELVFVRAEGQDDGTEIYTWYEETVRSDVKKALASQYGWSDAISEQVLSQGGLRIYTCYDPDIQAVVDEIYTNRENLNYTSKNGQLMQSTIAVIDNQTHNLVAIAGQFGDKTVNLGSNYANGDGNRSPGSSFKPLAVYAPALEFNQITPYSVIDDYPYQVMGGKAWPVNNGTTHYRGYLTVLEAVQRSLNTVAVRILGDLVTPEESFNFVQDRFHIDLEEGRMVYGEWKDDYTLSMALGGLTNGTNVRDMAEAYAVFPNGGYYSSSRTFTRVTQVVNGVEQPLLEVLPEEEEVLKPQTAWYMNEMLQQVFVGVGTAGGQGIRGQHAAGKTGTTSDNNDRWFVGYTPYYTAAVWCGYENPYRVNLSFNPSLRLWRQVMTRLHEGLPNKDYDNPGGQRAITYCRDSGLLATPWCAMDPRGSRSAKGAVFPEGYPEGNRCTYHTEESVITVCLDCPVLGADGAPTNLYHQAGEFCPEDRRQEICYPNYVREQIGSAAADDAGWRYEVAASYGPCTLHTEAPPEEPDPNDPNNPVDPNNPQDPNHSTDPTNPSDPTEPTDPNQTDVPINPVDPNPPDPLAPSEGMVG